MNWETISSILVLIREMTCEAMSGIKQTGYNLGSSVRFTNPAVWDWPVKQYKVHINKSCSSSIIREAINVILDLR